MKLSPVQLNRVQELKSSMFWDVLSGNYKNYKSARKEFAKLAVQDFESVKKVQGPGITGVPLFSKMGLKMAYVMVRDLFRVKTPEEKLLKQMARSDKLKQKHIKV